MHAQASAARVYQVLRLMLRFARQDDTLSMLQQEDCEMQLC